MGTNNKFTYYGTYAPLPVRLVNAIARQSKPGFNKLITLEADKLLRTAKRKTGLSDWGNPSFKEALNTLLNSVEQEGKLTFFGRFIIKQFLVDNLCNRLNINETLTRFPQIQEQAITKPIFVTGWYRTGTTYLHNLLASHPKLKAPLYWELRTPYPDTESGQINERKIIRELNLINRIHAYLAPGFSTAHAMYAEKPEECLHLFENALSGTTAFVISEAKSYAWWLLNQDMHDSYAFYKLQLQLLNWQRPGHPWVLKWPYHLWHLDTLLDVFPDATIIHIHRDPCEAIPSVCSLSALARSSFVESIDTTALGKFWLEYSSAGLQRGLQARKRIAQNQIIDVRYTDLKTNPKAVMQKILQKMDLERDEDWINSIGEPDKNRQRKQKTAHQYSLSQFGLNETEIREHFALYIHEFDLTRL